MIEVPPPDLYQNEQMSLFHLIKRRKRREQRTITHIMGPNGEIQISMKGILNTFSDCLRRKYAPIHVDDGCIGRMATAGHQRLPEAWKVTLDRPLTTDELYRAIHKGGGRKAPGRDGISNECQRNLDMDKSTSGRDTAYGPSPHTQRMACKTAVPLMASSKTPSYAVDTSAHGLVPDANEPSPISP